MLMCSRTGLYNQLSNVQADVATRMEVGYCGESFGKVSTALESKMQLAGGLCSFGSFGVK